MDNINRIMLKLSGEALADGEGGYNDEEIANVASQVQTILNKGMQVAIVIGGGNLWRGRTGQTIERTRSDSIGMLATVMNCIYVSERFKKAGIGVAVMTPFVCGAFTELFNKAKALEYMNAGKVVFFAGGTGHPYFSTDTATVLRAIEIEADCIFAAKSIDGVYDKDPGKNPDAKKYDVLTFDEVIEKNLQVIDMTASIMCKEQKMPMRLFSLYEENSIVKAFDDDFNGTRILV